MTDLKTVLVNALEAQAEGSGYDVPYVYDRGDGFVTVDGRLEIDRLAQVIKDHLTPPKVWSVYSYGDTIETFRSKEKAEAFLAAWLADQNYPGLEDWSDVSEDTIHDDDAADRLIEGLAGKDGDA